MRYLITGAAGFIGSHLSEALVKAGHSVVGLDAFIDYYPRANKEDNLSWLRTQPNFTFLECDLRHDDLTSALEGVDVIYHLAAMPGLLMSWTKFDLYTTCNIQATQRLLEAARNQGNIRQFIHASTSSIYGEVATGPETTIPKPVSPYGITKLASEHLVQTFDRQFGLPTSILRFFSVYGPRQRPDMGYQIFVDRILSGQPITVFGDGTQSRANTYVTDIVQGALLASEHFISGSVYNIGGADEVSLNQAIEILEEVSGRKAVIEYGPARPGEQSRAAADFMQAREKLGYQPSVSIHDGLAAQVAWYKGRLAQQQKSWHPI